MTEFFLSDGAQPLSVVIIIAGLVLIGILSYLEDKYGN